MEISHKLAVVMLFVGRQPTLVRFNEELDKPYRSGKVIIKIELQQSQHAEFEVHKLVFEFYLNSLKGLSSNLLFLIAKTLRFLLIRELLSHQFLLGGHFLGFYLPDRRKATSILSLLLLYRARLKASLEFLFVVVIVFLETLVSQELIINLRCQIYRKRRQHQVIEIAESRGLLIQVE